MDGYTLRSVVQALEYPTTIRIVRGSVTSEEGKCFSDKDNNVLTLYSRGLRVYVPPVTNASLRRRCRNTNVSRRTTRYKSADYGAKTYENTENLVTSNVFVSANTKLKYNTFVSKVYKHVSDILVDLPYAVKVHQPIFGCGDDGNMMMIAKDDVILVDKHAISHNVLSGSVKGHNIQITRDCIDATSLPGPNTPIVITTVDVLYKDSNWQLKEMIFEDEDVQETYEVEVGFNVLPMSEQPLLCVCCASGEAATLIEGVDNHLLKIKNVWCLHIRFELMDGVKVQIIDTDTRSAFRTEFGKQVGRDCDGFSMYNLYGKSSGYIERTAPQGPPPRLPRRSTRNGSVRQTDLHHPLPYDEAIQKHSSPIFVNSCRKKSLSSNEEHMETSLRKMAINQLTDDAYVALDNSPLTATKSTSLTSQHPLTKSTSLTSQHPSTKSTSLTDADYLEPTPRRLCPDVPADPVETHPPLPRRSRGGGSVHAVTPPTSISESLLVDDEALLEEVFLEDEHITQGQPPSENKVVKLINDAAADSDDDDDDSDEEDDDDNDDDDDGGCDGVDGGGSGGGDGDVDGDDDDDDDGGGCDGVGGGGGGGDGDVDGDDDGRGGGGDGCGGHVGGGGDGDTTTNSQPASHKTKSVLPIHGSSISSDEHKLLEQEDTPIELMKISEVANMFRKYKLDRVAEICEEHIIDGTILSDLEEDDLMNEPFNLKGYVLKKVLLIQKGHRPK
ncbi:uncharacterized protein [Argopecten irradians]|uniref:uncharacterized protein n=1 Tax=Argopecten irradians TaxID=31199 RepID=UPI003721683D